MKHTYSSGLSVLEVIIAAAIFVIFATPAVIVVIQGINSNRLSVEQTVATQFASEGMEAVRSIKNQAYNNLLTPNPTPRGVQRVSNVWTFKTDSTTDTLAHNTTDNYIRTIKVEDARRDATPPNGNIVASGGTVDPDTKKVSSIVTWNFNAARPESVTFISYLTDWRKALAVFGGMLVYGDTTTTPKYRIFDSTANTFSAETPTFLGASALNVALRTSPTKQEAVAGYFYNAGGGTLQIMCYNGTSWTNEWTAVVGGTGTTKRFDIAYETNSGDVMVLYSKNSASNEMAYRTKAGSADCGNANWSGETILNTPTAPVRTSGIVQWIKMAWDKRASSNLITAIWADAASDLSAAVWSGSAWENEPSAVTETSLEVIAAAQDIDDFDVEYESSSGDVMVVWANSAGANGTNGVRYRTCTGGTSTCTWNAVTTPPTWSDDAQNLDISANPTNDQIIFASIGDAGDDLQVGRWDGSAWVNVANKDTAAETAAAGAHLVTTGWVISGATTRGIVVYNDSNTTNLNYIQMTPGATPTWSATVNFTPSPVFGNPRKWYDIQMNPLNQSQLLLILSDTNVDLFAKQLVIDATPTFTWSDTEGGSALEITLGQAIASPFGFAYWRNP